MSVPTSSARSRRAFPRTIRATPRSLPITWATMSAIAPGWRLICSRPTPSPSSRRCCSPTSSSPPLRDTIMLLPLVELAGCIVTSVIGTYFVRLGADQGIYVRGALQGADRDRHSLDHRDRQRGGRLADWLPRQAADDGGRHHRLRRVELRGRRPGGDRAYRLDHRILHLDRIPPGAQHRQQLDHRRRHQCDPGPRDFDGRRRRCRCW